MAFAAERKRRWTRAVIVSVGTLVVLLFIFLDPIVRSSVKRDVAGAVPRTDIAVIVTTVPPTAIDMDHPATAHVTVRYRGGLYSPRDIVGSDLLHVGATARITYRVGRSGRIYVDRVEPLTTPLPVR